MTTHKFSHGGRTLTVGYSDAVQQYRAHFSGPGGGPPFLPRIDGFPEHGTLDGFTAELANLVERAGLPPLPAPLAAEIRAALAADSGEAEESSLAFTPATRIIGFSVSTPFAVTFYAATTTGLLVEQRNLRGDAELLPEQGRTRRTSRSNTAFTAQEHARFAFDLFEPLWVAKRGSALAVGFRVSGVAVVATTADPGTAFDIALAFANEDRAVSSPIGSKNGYRTPRPHPHALFTTGRLAQPSPGEPGSPQ